MDLQLILDELDNKKISYRHFYENGQQGIILYSADIRIIAEIKYTEVMPIDNVFKELLDFIIEKEISIFSKTK